MNSEIIESLTNQLKAKELLELKQHCWHLGIFAEPYLSYMMEGKKTIESRFSQKRLLPYNRITKDDIVFIKKSSGNILGYFTIKDIKFFDLKNTSISTIKEKYGKELCVSNEFWQQKSESNYATLIFIDKITKLQPFKITKKGMQTWIILNNK